MNNIKKIYLVSAFTNLSFGYSLWMLYLQDFGMTLIEVAILQSILNLAMFIFEIPTGLIADKFGEKSSILCSSIFLFLYALALAISPSNFIVQTVGFFLAGIAYALFSGANESLLYKTIKKYELIKLDSKIIGFNSAVSNWALVIAITIGGFVSEWSFELVFYMMAIAFFISFVISTRLENIVSSSKALESNDVDKKSESLFKALISLKKHVINIFVFSVIIALVSLYLIYGQEILNEQTDKKTFIGIIFSVAILLAGVSNLFSHKIEKMFSLKNTLVLSLISMILCFGLLIYGSLITYAISIIVVSIIFGILDPQIINYINSVCSDKYRTTINSAFNSMSTVIMMIMGPILAFSSDLTNESISFVFAIVSMSMCFIAIILLEVLNIARKKKLSDVIVNA